MESDVKNWLRKMEEVKKADVDLSRDEDLSIAIMNLISLEEHFYFTAMKTGNKKYLAMLNSIRELRKNMLRKIVSDPKGEEWCISKHLLAASMRLIEVGTKELSKGNDKDAAMFFRSSFGLYSMFFAINMKIVGAEKIADDTELEKDNGLMERFSNVVKKIVDCCKE